MKMIWIVSAGVMVSPFVGFNPANGIPAKGRIEGVHVVTVIVDIKPVVSVLLIAFGQVAAVGVLGAWWIVGNDQAITVSGDGVRLVPY